MSSRPVRSKLIRKKLRRSQTRARKSELARSSMVYCLFFKISFSIRLLRDETHPKYFSHQLIHCQSIGKTFKKYLKFELTFILIEILELPFIWCIHIVECFSNNFNLKVRNICPKLKIASNFFPEHSRQVLMPVLSS